MHQNKTMLGLAFTKAVFLILSIICDALIRSYLGHNKGGSSFIYTTNKMDIAIAQNEMINYNQI